MIDLAQMMHDLYCTPKIHKQGNPLCSIVAYTGSITYKIASSLADLLDPLLDKTKYHIKSSKHLAEEPSENGH